MASPKNRAAVEEALGAELERDRTKTYVVEISPLGLVEMTRQNVTDGPREIMTKKCPTCGGDGIVISEHTAAVDIERRLRMLPTPGSRSKAFKVEVNAKVASLVAGPGGSRLRELEETTKRVFFLVGKDGEHLDHFRVLEQGTLEKVAPKLPVEVGQELELKLGEVGLYDAHAGVAKVEDVEIVVGDAASLVGKKVKARVTAVTDGMAWAELLSPVTAGDDPLTAEAEAEKPTRAKRPSTKKSTDETGDVTDELVDEDEADELEPDDDGLETGEVESEAEASADGEAPATPAKKRTRRGTRGGRNRKKPGAAAGTASGAAAANGGEPAALAEPGAAAATDAETESELATSDADEAVVVEQPAEEEPRSAGPVIHLPGRELEGEDSAENGDGPATPAKKRTRRGSRGGKNRRKKPAVAGEAAAALAIEGEPEIEAPESEVVPEEVAELEPERTPEPEAAPEPETASENGDGDWTYTPMSQWGDRD